MHSTVVRHLCNLQRDSPDWYPPGTIHSDYSVVDYVLMLYLIHWFSTMSAEKWSILLELSSWPKAAKETEKCSWADGILDEHCLYPMFSLPLYLHLKEGIRQFHATCSLCENFLSATVSEEKTIAW